MKNFFTTNIKTLILALILSIGASYALAYTPPTTTPPGGNVPAPLNTGTVDQTKLGGITAKYFLGNQGIFRQDRISLTPLNIFEAIQILSGRGINVTNSGDLYIKDGNQDVGKVLTSDASGKATWQALSGGGGATLPVGNPYETLHYFGGAWVSNNILKNDGLNVSVGVPTGPTTTKLAVNSTVPNSQAFIAGNLNSNLTATAIGTAGQVGIRAGVSSMGTEALYVNGTVRIGGGSPDVGKVLTSSNTNGLATWEYLIPQTALSGQVLTWNGTSWVAQTPSGGLPAGDTDQTLRFNGGTGAWESNDNLLNNNSTVWIGGYPSIPNNIPGTAFTVNGKMRLVDGTESDGYVLTSDTNGNASWQPYGAESAFQNGTIDGQTIRWNSTSQEWEKADYFRINNNFTNGGATLVGELKINQSSLLPNKTSFNDLSGIEQGYVGFLANSSNIALENKKSGGSMILKTIGGGRVIVQGASLSANVLDVQGLLKVAGGNPGIGKVLTSDANGLASWQDPGASSSSSKLCRVHARSKTAYGAIAVDVVNAPSNWTKASCFTFAMEGYSTYHDVMTVEVGCLTSADADWGLASGNYLGMGTPNPNCGW